MDISIYFPIFEYQLKTTKTKTKMVHNKQSLEFLMQNLRVLQDIKKEEMTRAINSYKFWVDGEWKVNGSNVITEKMLEHYTMVSKTEMDNLHYLNNWIQNQIADAELLLKLV